MTMRLRMLPPLATVAVAAALLIACGGGDDPTIGPPDSPTEGAAPFTTGPGVATGSATTEAGNGSGVWHGTAETVSGEDVDLASYVGRDVAVWFWAPW